MKVFLLILLLISIIATAFSGSINRDMCSQPAQAGRCFAYMERYHYKSDINECMKFIYGGCGGNNNNFMTREACEVACKV
ncbi:unnamed protein product [Hermetia illucens]|uniref:BPTI/Kunitz inhibitor domain-containing protein n=2 Tax=Hermetia illucens TaxID=343691 RepID=A0A7R8YNA7_HERIL|nr:unnamed protein product [Hermetia illucens]